jgi:diguanylate cyclase (GGDEF)-like protein
MRENGKTRRILVVDDEQAVRELIARHFRRAGDQVVLAASAEDVRDRGHAQRTWDVVVSDIHLPGESGVELARELAPRADSLVLITGDSDRVLAAEALKDLRAGYLLKPFELFELDAAVKLAAGGLSSRPSTPEWMSRAKHIATQPIRIKVRSQRVPLRALLFSFAAMIVPLLGTMLNLSGEGTAQDPLLWVAALIPPFLLSYYRGWQGSAAALALGMATLVTGQAIADGMGTPLPAGGTLVAMLIIFIFTCLGAGWLSSALHQHRHDAEANALLDPLTGLANRAHLEHFMQQRLAAAHRAGTKLAVVFLDIDHFKRWNDELGHEAGDQALVAFAGVLMRSTRTENLAARFGGEEFVVVLNDADYDGVMNYVQRLRDALQHVRPYGRNLTASIGVALQWEGMHKPSDLIAAADAAVYAAKASGRDCVRFFGRESELKTPPSLAPAAA